MTGSSRSQPSGRRKAPPPKQTQVLHLRPSAGSVRRVNNLIEVASAYAFKGAQSPEVADEIEEQFERTKSRFLTFLANLEQRAKR